MPFPHAKPSNDLTGDPWEIDDDEEFDRALNAFEDRYWNPDNVNGAIPICHQGCANRDWLIVSGPEAGNMWHDARADLKGLSPIAIRKKKRVTFLQSYLSWLD